jgi:hypothetical protein
MNRQDNFIVLREEQSFNGVEVLFKNLDISDNTRIEYCSRARFFIDYVRENGFTRNSYLDYKRYLAKRIDLTVST